MHQMAFRSVTFTCSKLCSIYATFLNGALIMQWLACLTKSKGPRFQPQSKLAMLFHNICWPIIFNYDNLSYSAAKDTPKRRTQQSSILRRSASSESESEICDAKLQMIQMKVEEHRLQKDAENGSISSNEDKIEQAAVCIQKMWRGYYTRNKDKQVQDMFRTLQTQRADQYIQ